MTTNTMDSKQQYFAMLKVWVDQANLYQKSFPFAHAGVPYQPPSGGIYNNNVSQQQRLQNDDPNNILANGGYEYVLAPIWKRVVAECIDIAILFIIKLILTFAIVDIFNIDLGSALDLNSIKSTFEDDYTQLFSLASELIVLELITKLLVCIYETMWTAEGQGNMGGATPGKLIMGIRILYVESVHLLDPLVPVQQPMGHRVRALLFPACNPGWKRALCRAFIKNVTVLIPIVYPLCFITFLFRNSRMGYDILTKTIVVEENQMPILRRM